MEESSEKCQVPENLPVKRGEGEGEGIISEGPKIAGTGGYGPQMCIPKGKEQLFFCISKG